MSSEELQNEEREVLMSIYDGDTNFKQLSEDVFQYKVECGESRAFLLEIQWSDDYPNILPNVNLDAFFNNEIIEVVKDSIVSQVIEQAKEYLGMSMTYNLFEWAKENALDLLQDQPAADYQLNGICESTEKTYIDDPEKDIIKSKEKKEKLSKSQKRKLADRVDQSGNRLRGWDWVDVIKHLNQVGTKEQQCKPPS